MPFLLLLVLTPACLPDSWPQPGSWIDSPARAALLTLSGVACLTGLAAFTSWRIQRRIRQEPLHRPRLVLRYAALRRYQLFGLVAFYGVALYGIGWGWAVHTWLGSTAPLPPGAELLVLAPFLGGLVLSWIAFYDADRAVHESALPVEEFAPFWSRWEYLAYQVRHNLVFVFIPVGLLMLQKSVLWLIPQDGPEGRHLGVILVVLTGLTVYVAMPWVLRVAMSLRSLPPGPLRSRLLATADRLDFRCSDILLWNTRNGVVNAMVMGILPGLRYVVLSDRLTTDLAPAEVEAVFGHEVGHVKHRHMLYYLGFLFASMAVVWTLGAVYLRPLLHDAPDLQTREDLATLFTVAVLGTYIFVVFGFLSRRCERQADVYGCRTVSCGRNDCTGHGDETLLAPHASCLCPTGIRTFINALEKVAYLNGIPRDRPGWLQSWQHSTIGRRVAFLQGVLADPRLEPRFQSRVTLVKWGLLLSLVGLLFLLGAVHGWAVLQL